MNRIAKRAARGLVKGTRGTKKCFKYTPRTGVFSSFNSGNDWREVGNKNTTMVVVLEPIFCQKRFYARGRFGSKDTRTTVVDQEGNRTKDSNLTLSPSGNEDTSFGFGADGREPSVFSSHEEHPQVSQSGLSKYMSKVNAWTAGGVVGSLAVATVASTITLASPALMWGSLLGGLGASLFSIYKLNSTQPTYTNERDPQTGELVRVSHNSSTRKGYFYGLIVGNGVALSSFIGRIALTNPIVLPKALILSTAVFAVCYLISKRSKDSTMQALAIPVAAGIGILIVTQLAAMGAFAIWGANAFSAMAWRFDTYVGLAIFTASAIYSNYLAKRSYLDGKPDHLLMAASLYIDFMNILIRIMTILNGNRD